MIGSEKYLEQWRDLLRELEFFNVSTSVERRPTRPAIQRAVWLAVGMIDMHRAIVRIKTTPDGGIIFSTTTGRSTWRIEPDGSAALVTKIGDEQSRFTPLVGALP
jgi:hypothetical protein